MRCIYCKNDGTYELGNGQRKCKKCKRKFSPKRVQRELKIVECFCNDLTANECAKKHSFNYITVQKHYESIRKKIAIFLEEEYQKKKETKAFEEYIYLEKSKDPKKNIFDGYNFLTFDYGNKIYNILMPDLSRFKPVFLEDNLNEIYYKEFKSFLRSAKVQKNAKNRLIYQFWEFLEEFMVKFKGIKRDNFFYYLKEAEFKFNFDCNILKEILWKK